jgi:hypothetical protein
MTTNTETITFFKTIRKSYELTFADFCEMDKVTTLSKKAQKAAWNTLIAGGDRELDSEYDECEEAECGELDDAVEENIEEVIDDAKEEDDEEEDDEEDDEE